jgi:hypothetical protein
LEAVQQGIESARSQPVAVSSELCLQAEAEDRRLGCVVQDVQPNQTTVQLALRQTRLT